jgi:hypothetical protein
MSLDKMKQMVISLANAIENDEKLAIPVLAVKLAKCSEAYPHDQTIGSMSRVIEKMASNNSYFISKAELKSLYKKLYSNNTKFAQLFENELGEDISYEPARSEYKHDDSNAVSTYNTGDQVLANALESVFDKTIAVKMFSKTSADKALKSVASTLNDSNLNPTKLSVDSGNEKFIIIKADYETPKGVTSFFVPVEINDNKVVQSSVFMGNAGPLDINYSNIKKYLKTTAGSKLQVTSNMVLDALTKASSNKRRVSNAEMSLIRLNANRAGKSEFFQDQVVGLKVAEASVKDVELPKYNEFESFEQKFNSPQGIATFQFGAETLKIASESVTRDVIGFGYKNPQISITGSDDKTVFYGVSLDGGKVAFTVPVKIAGNKITKPNLMLCQGSVSTFNKENINNLYVNNQTDYKVAAAASPLFGLKPSDLINNIKMALSENNHAKAEDALNVLARSGDAKAYATGFVTYMSGLTNKTASVKEDPCTMIVKSSVSEHPICGHTGLPVHKVYKDQYGNCRPLYRKGMDETYEGASFMNSKIFG